MLRRCYGFRIMKMFVTNDEELAMDKNGYSGYSFWDKASPDARSEYIKRVHESKMASKKAAQKAFVSPQVSDVERLIRDGNRKLATLRNHISEVKSLIERYGEIDEGLTKFCDELAKSGDLMDEEFSEMELELEGLNE
jgi:hypothetical protein